MTLRAPMLMFPSTRRWHLARNKVEVSAIRDPKAAKSFRAAADRIVRQESAMPSVVTRLLAPSTLGRRHIGSAADEWSIRLAALATLGQYDGLTFIVDGPAGARLAYNVADDPADDPAARSAIDETRRTGATVQAHTSIRLADDRIAGSAMVAPLVSTEAVSGVLVALRVGRSFAAADALTASGISELVALELAREAAARGDDAHRSQAFALYELARLALFGDRLVDTLQDVTALLVNALDHDLAQIWLFSRDGSLELSAAEPHRDDLRFGHIYPSEHDALAEALHQNRIVRIGHGALRPWVPSETRELIVVPLADGARSVGLLVLGQARERYENADEDLAGLVSRFISRVVVRAPTNDQERPREHAAPSTTEPETDRDWVEEPQLTGS